MCEQSKNEGEIGGKWAMPPPIFRSTGGSTPGAFAQEAGNTIEPPLSKPSSHEPIQPVRSKTQTEFQRKNSGCFQVFLTAGGLLLIGVLAVIAILIYLLYFYRPADNTTF
jgi:hypothetical protein